MGETGYLKSLILKGKAMTGLLGSFVSITKELFGGNLEIIFSPSEFFQDYE